MQPILYLLAFPIICIVSIGACALVLIDAYRASAESQARIVEEGEL